MVINETFRSNLRFPEHTEEKLEGIKYYGNKWFLIVKSQKVYVVDCNAGTGYCIIEGKPTKILGSALIAVDLFKKDGQHNLKVFLIEKERQQYELLENNISAYISKNNINAKIGSEIIIINDDWTAHIDGILNKTKDGIRLFLLDPFGIKSMPWDKVNFLIKNGMSEFGYKESGFEVLINWAWHKIRRDLGIYYKKRLENQNLIYKFTNLDNFFGPVNWREIANRFLNNIFIDNLDDQIEELAYELIKAYVKKFFNYFKFVKVHPIHSRKKRKEAHLRDKGKIKYFLIFASNYHGALDIIDIPFKKSREVKVFSTPPKDQQTLHKWGLNIKKRNNLTTNGEITIEEKIKRLEEELGTNFYSKNKEIIEFLYGQKHYDYGCPDFVLFNEFNIDQYTYLPFLLDNNIIGKRKKRSKSGNVNNYYYLIHPILVDRREYLFLKDKVYEFKDGDFKEINRDISN